MQDKMSRIKQSELCFVCIEFQFHTFFRIPIPIKLCKQIILMGKLRWNFGEKRVFAIRNGANIKPFTGLWKVTATCNIINIHHTKEWYMYIFIFVIYLVGAKWKEFRLADGNKVVDSRSSLVHTRWHVCSLAGTYQVIGIEFIW